MNLDEATKQKVAAWIAEGLKLSDIQSKLASELGVTLTYMETRFLVDDLKLMPKDQPPPQPVGQLAGKAGPGASAPSPVGTAGAADAEDLLEPEAAAPQPGGGAVAVAVDRLARPGALVSGSVTFSDGNSGTWYLDQLGRLGVAPKQQGYRPSPEDMQAFQLQLQGELAKLGF